MKKIVLLFSFLCLFHLGDSAEQTYFQYTCEEIDYLTTKKASKLEITPEQIHKWDEMIDGLANKEGLPEGYMTRMKALLVAAQGDGTILSDNKATLDPLTLKILHLYFPEAKQPQNYQSDAYSEALAQLIYAKAKQEFEGDRKIEN